MLLARGTFLMLRGVEQQPAYMVKPLLSTSVDRTRGKRDAVSVLRDGSIRSTEADASHGSESEMVGPGL